jgi:hypothetical protein
LTPILEAGAQCVSSARWDLCEGCRVTGIPIATGQRGKDFGIQAFFSKGSIEAFVTTILPRLARLKIDQLNVLLIQILLELCSNPFAAVITTNGTGSSEAGDQFTQNSFDVPTLQVPIGFDG